MKHAAVCFVSVVLGVVTALWLRPAGYRNSATTVAAAVEPGSVATQVSPLSVPATDAPLQPPRVYNSDGLSPDEAVAAYVYETNNRSVTNIATRIGSARTLFRENPTEDAGSGFVLDRQGHVLTNYHVVENAQRIQVTLFNGESFEADPVGVDPINDMAVVKVNAPEDLLYPIRFGNSSDLRVGMRVFAIGNPFGLERTMTTGIISSLNRTLPVTRARSIKSVIQIDAAINPGNSGGPLLNSHGDLIGINTAIASSTGQNSGIGFAIPVNLVARVVPELIAHGRVIRPEHGIVEVLRTEEGLRILTLDPAGPAARAGLRGPEIQRKQRGFVVLEYEDRSRADLIVGVDGKKTLKVDEFLSEVESRHPGDVIQIDIIRGNQPLSVPLKLE